MQTETIPYTLEVLERLRLNTHFQASNRRSHYHVLCGLPIIIFNLILVSVFLLMYRLYYRNAANG